MVGDIYANTQEHSSLVGLDRRVNLFGFRQVETVLFA